MGVLVEFENARGTKTLVNPDHVISVEEVYGSSQAVITSVGGEKIPVKATVEEVKRKLGM